MNDGPIGELTRLVESLKAELAATQTMLNRVAEKRDEYRQRADRASAQVADILELTKKEQELCERDLAAEKDAHRRSCEFGNEMGKMRLQQLYESQAALAEARGLLARACPADRSKPGLYDPWGHEACEWGDEARAFLSRTAPPEFGCRFESCPGHYVENEECTCPPGPRRCASCDEPWPHPGKLCEPRDVAFLPGAPEPAPACICGERKHPASTWHHRDCPARCTCGIHLPGATREHMSDCPARRALGEEP